MSKFDDNGVDAYVCPTPDGIFGGVLPRLHAIAVVQIMCGFPIVVDLITVLYRREGCTEDMRREEDVECDYRFRA